jgi:hypothetical protein
VVSGRELGVVLMRQARHRSSLTAIGDRSRPVISGELCV